MARNNRIIFIRLTYILLDVLFVFVSIMLAAWLRSDKLPFDITVNNLFFDLANPFQFVFVFWILAVLFFNSITGLYQTHRELLEGLEVWQVTKSVFLSGILTIVSIYVLKIEGFPRSIILLTAVFATFFLSLWRVLKRRFVDFLVAHGYNNFNVLIIGAGKVGVALAQEIKARPNLGLRVAGFLDDFKTGEEKQTGHRILGKIEDFHRLARHEFINKVFITVHHDSQVFLRLLELAKALRIAVRVVPQGFEFTNGELTKYNIGFIPILEYSEEEHLIKQAGKRVFDFTSSLTMLILSSPVLLFFALLVKMDSRGPVFYVSRRYGRKGKIFPMLKFRSMVDGAEKRISEIQERNEVDGPIFKIKKDPRVTRLGRFFRRYSIDELPQLINVLKGEMSLVGPRPLPIEQIEKEDRRQLRRLAVRPGITGLWQIRGRSDISFSRLVKWDVWYINNWSFWLDLNILMQTIPIVFRGRGAY